MSEAVTVDRDFARFGAKSYAINKINSVEVRERKPNGKGGAIVCGVLATFCGFGALGSLTSPDGGTIVWLIVAAVFGFAAYSLWQESKIVEYQLFLMTSSSEAQAFVSRREDEVISLRDRIEQAMAGRA